MKRLFTRRTAGTDAKVDRLVMEYARRSAASPLLQHTERLVLDRSEGIAHRRAPLLAPVRGGPPARHAPAGTAIAASCLRDGRCRGALCAHAALVGRRVAAHYRPL